MNTKHLAQLAGLFLSLILSAAPSFAQEDNAQVILKQARAALGDNTLQSLSVSGTARRRLPGVPGEVMEEKLELSFLLPDKYLKTKTHTAPDGLGETKLLEGLDGDQDWTDVQFSGGDMMFIQSPGNGEDIGALKAAMLRERRAEFARYVIAFLLTPPANFPLEWSYAGKAEAPDGRADVLDAKGPDGFALRFFFEAQTHLPLLISYQTKLHSMMVMMAIPSEAGPGQSNQGATAIDLPLPAPETVGAQVEMLPERWVEAQIRLTDYQVIGGRRFPGRVRFALDGQPDEEWDALQWLPNANLTPEQFQPRKK